MDIRAAPATKTRSCVDMITVKIQKVENKIATKTSFYRQATAKCSILALQNAPTGAICNASMLH